MLRAALAKDNALTIAIINEGGVTSFTRRELGSYPERDAFQTFSCDELLYNPQQLPRPATLPWSLGLGPSPTCRPPEVARCIPTQEARKLLWLHVNVLFSYTSEPRGIFN